MGFFTDFFGKNGNAHKIFDPAGIFHEGGWFGWDIFGLDTTSEDNIAAAAVHDEQIKIDSAEQFNASVDSIKRAATIIIVGAIVLFVLIYSVKKGWITFNS